MPWSLGRGGTDCLDRTGRHAAAVLLPVELAVAPHLDPAPLGEGVHDRGADAVQTAGDFVAAAAELAAGVEDRHDHLQGRLVLLGVLVDRDTAAVVGDGHHAVGADAGHDRVGMTAQRLVDRVVDDLAHEVMQTAHVRAADVHAWAAADSFQSLEHLDGRGVVGRGLGFRGRCHRSVLLQVHRAELITFATDAPLRCRGLSQPQDSRPLSSNPRW